MSVAAQFILSAVAVLVAMVSAGAALVAVRLSLRSARYASGKASVDQAVEQARSMEELERRIDELDRRFNEHMEELKPLRKRAEQDSVTLAVTSQRVEGLEQQVARVLDGQLLLGQKFDRFFELIMERWRNGSA